MQALIAPLKELAEYDEIRKVTRQGKGTVALSGCVDSQKLHMIYGLSDGLKYKVIVTYSDLKAKEIYEEYRFYDRNVMLYPAKDLIFFQADIHGNQLVQERIKTLRRVVEGKPVTIVTTYAALMTPQVLWEEKDIIRTERGGSLDESKLASRLVAMGYEKAYQVESPGQFSIRGGIVDIFDLTEENPYRIELWGDEVESIRSFDILSQRSIEKLESITVYPATEFVLSEEQIRKGISKLEKEADKQEKIFRDAHQPEEAHRIATQVSELKEQLLEFQSKINLEGYIRYFYENTVTMPELLSDMAGRSLVFYIDEPARVKEQADAIELEFRESMEQRARKGYVLPGQMNILYSGEQVAATLEKNAVVTLATMETKYGYFKKEMHVDIAARNIAPYNNSFEALVKDLKKYKKNGYRVLLLSGSRTRARRLAEDLRNTEDAGLTAVYTEDPMREVQPGEILTYYGHVNKGFEYPWLKFVVLSESDIFGAEKRKKKKKKLYQGQKINDFNDLKIGDYVVHETHGLGIYKGIEKVEVDKVVKDYLKIEYRDGGNLYILATGLDVIQKYASADAAKKPKLNKLGGKEWEHTKTKVRSAVSAVAKDLVELYAVRQQSEGYAFGKDTVCFSTSVAGTLWPRLLAMSRLRAQPRRQATFLLSGTAATYPSTSTANTTAHLAQFSGLSPNSATSPCFTSIFAPPPHILPLARFAPQRAAAAGRLCPHHTPFLRPAQAPNRRFLRAAAPRFSARLRVGGKQLHFPSCTFPQNGYNMRQHRPVCTFLPKNMQRFVRLAMRIFRQGGVLLG